MEAPARDIIRPIKVGRQLRRGAPADTLHWRGVTGRNSAEKLLSALLGGEGPTPEPTTGTLETFVTLAAIQLAIRRLART